MKGEIFKVEKDNCQIFCFHQMLNNDKGEFKLKKKIIFIIEFDSAVTIVRLYNKR